MDDNNSASTSIDNEMKLTDHPDSTTLRDEICIQITKTSSEIRQMDDNGSASTSIAIALREKICIYQVPVNIRRLNKDVYTPQVICIGPIHQKNENQDMKKLKQRYFKQFFNRPHKEKRELFQKELESTIKDCEVEIRNCYEDDSFELCKDPKDCEVDFPNCFEDDSSTLCEDQKVFLKMILWDAVFIFELFLKSREYKNDKGKSLDKYKCDYIIDKPCLIAAIQRDLILLENQLPFFILDKLYEIATKYIKTGCSCSSKTDQTCCSPKTDKTCCSCLPKTDPPKTDQTCCSPKTDKTCCSCLPKTDPPKTDCSCLTFMDLTCEFFHEYKKKKLYPQEKLHFTDLVRSFLLPEDLKTKGGQKTITNLYRATRLHQAGMKFKPRKDERLLDIRAWSTKPQKKGNSIKKGELHVPVLEIDDHTEHLFRNLIALEQCHYPYEAFICEYVKFLDFLVDTKEDVDLLIKSEVIISRLGESDDVAKLINKLCQEIVDFFSCYNDIAEKLNDYYDSPYNESKAFLRRQYFKNVWIGSGTVAGLIVLLITLGNFVRSFL